MPERRRMILPIPKTLAKLFDEHFGPIAFKTMLAQRLQSIQQGAYKRPDHADRFRVRPKWYPGGSISIRYREYNHKRNSGNSDNRYGKRRKATTYILYSFRQRLHNKYDL